MQSDLTISGFTRYEAAALKEVLPDLQVREATNKSSVAHGEPISITIIIAGSSIAAFARWLEKNRRKKRIHYKVEVQRPDGSTYSQLLDYDEDESLSPESSSKLFETVLEAILKKSSDDE